MRQAYGGWVVGEDFFGREKEVELFIEQIDCGAHLLIVGQRRLGKTSLLKEAESRLKERYICIYVDLEKAENPMDAVVEISKAVQPHKSVWNRAITIFSNILGSLKDGVEEISLGELGIKIRAGLTTANWTEKGDQLFDILAKAEKPVLLMLDEAPILVNKILRGENTTITSENRATADKFMSWLRDNSIRHQGRIRVVLTGSIGFESVLNQANLSATINNFYPFEIKPWNFEVAEACLDKLAKRWGIIFLDGAEKKMVQKLGCCIPHHVQMFFSKAYDKCKFRGTMTFAISEVEELYNTEMLSLRGHADLTHYEERLKLVLEREHFIFAEEMLTEAAVNGRLTPTALAALRRIHGYEAEIQKTIMNILLHDGYLKSDGRDFVFVSNLLRDWWKNSHEAFYIPVMERGA